MTTSRRLVAVLLTIFLVTFQGNAFAQNAPSPKPNQQTVTGQDTDLQLQRILRIFDFLLGRGHDPEFVSKFNDFLSVLFEAQTHFVDKKTMVELLDLAAKGMINGLDPYSNLFVGEKEAQSILKSFSEFSYSGGIGLSIGRVRKHIYVTEVFEGYSAAKAGIEPGDEIKSVNGQSTYGMSVDKVIQLVKGEEGTKVSVEIDNNKRLQKPTTFELTRQKIHVDSVVFKDLGDGIGYIKVRAFNHDPFETRKEFSSALRTLKGGKVVIDLRNNGGGSLAAVIGMLSDFLGPGKTVIIHKGRNSSSSLTTERPSLPDLPKKVVVLVNNFSASASEVMAGNMQYYKMAKIIGVRTFGKATIQIYYDLDKNENDHNPDNNTRLLMGITIARYFLPDGRDITAAGIVPDIEIEQPDDFRSYEYGTERDLQFQEAIKFLKEN